jgi:hypothetical protein
MSKTMKNNLLRKATTLVLGWLIICSSQALAFSSNYQKITITDNTLNPSQRMITQESVSVSTAVAVAVKVLDQAVTVVRTAAVNKKIPPELRGLVLPKLTAAQKSLANAQSSAQKGDNVEVARAIATAVSILGDGAKAVARADAGSANAIAEAIASAKEAQAIAEAQARSRKG